MASASSLDTAKASGNPENWSTIIMMCALPYSLLGSGPVVPIHTHTKGYWGIKAFTLELFVFYFSYFTMVTKV